jgi:starch synthase
MKIIQIASECAPYAKTGGLADAVDSLARALALRDHQVTLILPGYRTLLGRFPATKIFQAELPMQRGSVPYSILALSPREKLANSPAVWVVDAPVYFDREGVYVDESGQAYADNAERFAFFTRAAIESLTELDPDVDIVHAHDWPTGLAPVYVREETSTQDRRRTAGTVFTIHNLAFLGRFGADLWPVTSLPRTLYNIEGLEFWGDWSMLKGGIAFADEITTVSPTYAREITTSPFGEGLDGLLRHRSEYLTGILNGMDRDAWNPETDPCLPRNYDLLSWSIGKAECKRHFQESVGLPIDPSIPLLGMVGRLAHQKGTDLLVELAKTFLNVPLQLAILGQGEPPLESMIRQFGQWYPDRVTVHVGFDESLARRIYAASDGFLMPSRFEPCGLSQMYALRYGAIPIVHAVGGLVDSVVDATPENIEMGRANGFHFHGVTPHTLLTAIERARHAWAVPRIWRGIVHAAMAADFSWQQSVPLYEAVYRRAQATARATPIRGTH